MSGGNIILEDYKDKWIGIKEAADYLGVNKDTIRNWIKKDSQIPTNKIGKQWKFKHSELDEWVKSGKSAVITQSNK
jgi:excisionase family DNA binding protein